MARPSATYRPRRAADSVLYQVVRDHYETFAAQAASWCDDTGLPPFIDREFRGFLRCGWLAGGFARLRCDGCGLDRLVPFTCKGRAVCPSCGGRRMAERAAHLVDQVFPEVPVRQWVLTLPHQLRYLLAWDHALCRTVVAVFMRAVLGFLRRQARARGVADGRSGAVVVIQRFGGAQCQHPRPSSANTPSRTSAWVDRRIGAWTCRTGAATGFLGRRRAMKDQPALPRRRESLAAPRLRLTSADRMLWAWLSGSCLVGARPFT